MLKQWETGQPILTAASHPVPWAYVTGDRDIEEAEATLTDMGIVPSTVRIIPAFGRDNKNFRQVMDAAAQLQPVPELLAIEGFTDLCERPESRNVVREFMSSASAYCTARYREWPNGLTIIGVVESPKQKPHERYANPRQRISGASAWGYHAQTVFVVEYLESDKECLGPDRTLFVCRKQGKRLKIAGQFDSQNRLIFA